MIPNTGFIGKWSKFSITFSRAISKFCYEILGQNWEETIFSNRQFGMRVYIGIVMIKVLE